MRAVTSQVVAVILAVSIPAGAMAPGPSEVPTVAIEGGNYPIGSVDGPASARPPHRVTLDPFLIDVYEVTSAEQFPPLSPASKQYLSDRPSRQLEGDGISATA